MTREVEFVVESLVLHGLPAPDRGRFAGALQSELERLLRERGIPPGAPAGAPAGASVEITRLGPLSVQAGLQPEALGAQVARCLYEKLWG